MHAMSMCNPNVYFSKLILYAMHTHCNAEADMISHVRLKLYNVQSCLKEYVFSDLTCYAWHGRHDMWAPTSGATPTHVTWTRALWKQLALCWCSSGFASI